MRSLLNNLGDPSLHLLAIAMIVVYLTFGRPSWSRDAQAEAPLPYCKVCHAHFLPGATCDCRPADDIANAFP
jgi:hypothetical protein